MFDERILNELINQQQLLIDINLELKKKQSLTKLLFLSLNQTNNHIQNLFSNLVLRQNRLLNYLIEENNQHVQRQTLVNLLQQVLSNENLPLNKLRSIHLKSSIKNTKQQQITSVYQGQTQINSNDDSILIVYWREKSLRSIPIRKSSSETCLKTWNFPKLERIKRNIS